MGERLFEWRYGRARVAVPTVAAFLDEYEALCRKHAMRFEAEYESDYDGVGYATTAIVPYDGDGDLGRLDIDSLDEIQGIPEAADIKKRLEDAERAETKARDERDRARKAEAARIKREELEAGLRSEGLMLSDGKKYKLVPIE